MLHLLLFVMSLGDTAAAASAAPLCESAEYRQFDFWVGAWDVTDLKTGGHAGTSLIEKLYGGCALRENWSEPGFTGGSLNTYAAADAHWHQMWVDQGGALREFVGGIDHGKMVLVARVQSRTSRRKTVLVRMTFTSNPDGTVRQYSDSSMDDGASWTFRYDYLYRRATPGAAAH